MKILTATPQKTTVKVMDHNGELWHLKRVLKDDEKPQGEYAWTSQAIRLALKIESAGEINTILWNKQEDQQSDCYSSNCTNGKWMKPGQYGGAVVGGVCAGCQGKGYMTAEDRKRQYHYWRLCPVSA